jgi:hypothetical protein
VHIKSLEGKMHEIEGEYPAEKIIVLRKFGSRVLDTRTNERHEKD